MTNFARFAGQKYLQEAILPLIRELLTSKTSWELDPSKLSSSVKDKTAELEMNQANLADLAQRVLNQLVSTVQLLPQSFRKVCGFLKLAVEQKFPESSTTAIGGFMFLRFFCPALVSPESFGLLRSVPPYARRALVLVTKVLQNLANQQPFKEQYMAPLNASFLEPNTTLVRDLLARYARVPVA